MKQSPSSYLTLNMLIANSLIHLRKVEHSTFFSHHFSEVDISGK